VVDYGLDVFGPEPGLVAAAIRREQLAVRRALVVALDDWAFCADDKKRTPRLRQVAGLADDDAWQRRYRNSVAHGGLDELKQLAEEARGKALAAVSLVLLASSLKGRGLRAEAAALLRDARGQHPSDFWIHLNLGGCLHDPRRPDAGTLDEALGCLRAAVALRPGSAPAHSNLGAALNDKGLVDEDIAEQLKAIKIDPKYGRAHNNLGSALLVKGRLDEAIVRFHKAIELDPKLGPVHTNLGLALAAKRQLDQAIVEHRKAIAIDPKDAAAHYNLGLALHDKGLLDQAIAEYHKAIEIDPKYSHARNNLGNALADKGRLDPAIVEYRKAIEFDPNNAQAHSNLGVALYEKGRIDEAIAECRKAIEIDPKFSNGHHNLGTVLQAKGWLDEAVAECRKAIDLDPKNAKHHDALGLALLRQGRFAEARDAARQALHLLAESDPQRAPATKLLRWCEGLLALDTKLTAILKGEAHPADTAERLDLAKLCQQYKKRYAAAVGFFTDAFAAEPNLAADLKSGHRYNAACAAALAGAGKGEDAAKLDDTERARLRQQALTWLRADLTAWGKLLEQQPDKARAAVLKTMQHWQQDADFASVRGDALAKLPETERKEWRKLWDDVAALLEKVMPEQK
jgi:tetratricopeptide (TPR) repeat protein